jgi:hypothetical protein
MKEGNGRMSTLKKAERTTGGQERIEKSQR